MKSKRKSKLLSIKDLTSEFYNSDKMKKGINKVEIASTWNKITSNQIQSRTKKLFVKENKLYIKVNSAPLRNELSNNRKVILEKFKAEHKYITEIFFI
ncbi:MAG: DUF721 domain-containing protein [Bacteroidota bacterium]|nr:DUF721 domain-containing protein [Bacteroidota bacterium]